MTKKSNKMNKRRLVRASKVLSIGVLTLFVGLPKYSLTVHATTEVIDSYTEKLSLEGKALSLEGDYTYNITNGEATIVKYEGPGGELIIPETLGGAPVVAIGDNFVFKDKSLTSVILPTSLRYIGSAAFQKNSITSITIPNSVTTIGNFAFHQNNLSSIVIPPNVETIRQFAFGNNELKNINILGSVTQYMGGLFSNQALNENIIFESTQAKNVSLSELMSYTGRLTTDIRVSNITNGVTYLNGTFIVPQNCEEFSFDFNSSEFMIQGTHLYTGTYNVRIQTKAENVIVNYVDEEGKEISNVPPQTISGNVGDSYDASTDIYKLTIDGYTLDESKLPANAKGTLSDQAQTVTYVYMKNPVKAADVTVNYVDEEGKEISNVPPQTISGNVGDSYDASTDIYKLTIDGYTLDESKLPANAKGTLSDQAQTVTYVYSKNEIPNITGMILIKYVDTDGNKISEDVVKSGTVGEAYSTEKKDIKGYTFKEVQGNATGQFTNQVQTVTYIYTKDKSDTVTPEPKPENKPDSKDKNNNQGTTSSEQHGLPATGENERMTMLSIILGLILLSLGVVVSIFRFKKVNK